MVPTNREYRSFNNEKLYIARTGNSSAYTHSILYTRDCFRLMSGKSVNKRIYKADSWCADYKVYTRRDQNNPGALLVDTNNPTQCDKCIAARNDPETIGCARAYIMEKLVEIHKKKGSCTKECEQKARDE